MAAAHGSRLLRRLAVATTKGLAAYPRNAPRRGATATLFARQTPHRRGYASTAPRFAGLMPDTHDPQPPSTTEPQHETKQATDISEDEYHEHADRFMESLHEKAEELQEGREDVEVEYAAGVLSLTMPQHGTFVINKQPPNKQIWLSSPISGPKRFDWVLTGESMHQKEGAGTGDWIYLRDGTSLTDLLRREVGISVDVDGEDPDQVKPSVDRAE